MEWQFILQLIVVLLASLSTFFSGFGLGTIMLPALMLSYSPAEAVAITAIIHLSNNVFKFILLKKSVDYKVMFRFALPSVVFAFLGAELLTYLDLKESLLEQILGGLILIFVIADFTFRKRRMQVTNNGQYLGGALSGLFGGLSGHQGAIRSAFLINCGLDKAAYIATGTALSLFIDFTRIPVYILNDTFRHLDGQEWIVKTIVLILFAVSGAIIGKRYLKKTTNTFVRMIVTLALVVFGVYMLVGNYI